MEDLDIEKIYCSPYKRAYQTAEILNKKITVKANYWVVKYSLGCEYTTTNIF